MELKLAYAVKAGRSERVLELWNGTRRICGIVDVEDERALEKICDLSGIEERIETLETMISEAKSALEGC